MKVGCRDGTTTAFTKLILQIQTGGRTERQKRDGKRERQECWQAASQKVRGGGKKRKGEKMLPAARERVEKR